MKLFPRKKAEGRKKYSEEEYMYASAKLSALSCGLLSEEKLEALADAENVSEVLDRLSEYGIQTLFTDDAPDVEKTLTSWLAGRYSELAEFCPDPELLAVVRSRYDCHNVKTAVKCRYLGVDPEPFVIDCGTVPAREVLEGAAKHEFSVLPPKMAAAAAAADKSVDENGNARLVDAVIDAACFEDMLEAAGKVGFEPVTELIKLKIDLTNLMTVLRIGRIRNADAAAALLQDSLIGGGNIPADKLREPMDSPAAAGIAEEAGYSSAASAIRSASSGAAGLESVYLECDRIFITAVKDITSMKALGAYPLISYVIGLEYEIKNLRIILSGKESGSDAQTIRERLRKCDV